MTQARTITARYPGTCAGCGGPIHPGDEVKHLDRGRTFCAACEVDPDAAPTTSSRSQRGGRRAYTVRTSSGWTGTRNVRGRCEDAPCCGCCTY